jgi:6-phosphogluconolactonase (cycloisomerase 2 family)
LHEYAAQGGDGAEISLVAPVNPGDKLLIEVGGAGQNGNSSNGAAGGGGQSSGDGQNGGAGGNLNGFDGQAGGGGGGATEVIDQTTGTVILDAGGGGGAGGGGIVQLADGGAGGDAGSAFGGFKSFGAGHSGQGGVPGNTGQYAASGGAGGTSGSGETPTSGAGTGGGGGGGYQPAGGGGTGGQAGTAGAGGSGGGAGASYYEPAASNVAIANGPHTDGRAVVEWGTPDTAPGVKSASFGFNNQPQSFTVPQGVDQIELAASGGDGGLGGVGAGLDVESSKTGYGARFDLVAPVSPGDQILIETGGAGTDANKQSPGVGGEASGDGQFGGPGGPVNNTDLDGDAGGGGGGGTEVIDQTTGTVILDAGGGGGGGGDGTGGSIATGPDGGNGGDAGSAYFAATAAAPAHLFGDGDPGAVSGAGAGGLFASTGIPAGYGGAGEQDSAGGGTGGGGGGGYQPAGGGGTAGGPGGIGAGGGGGGGAGASYVEPSASNVVVGDGVPASGSVRITWAAPQPLTTISLSSYSVQAGTPVTVTAFVAPPTGSSPAPTGTVAFDVDGQQVGTGTVNDGQATFTTSSPLAPGYHNITFQYQGDAVYAPVTSLVGPLTVNAPTSTTAFPSATTVYEGQPVTLTGIVSAQPATGPSVAGQVSFKPAVCGVPIPCGTATLNAGRKPSRTTLTQFVGPVTPGTYQITATVTPSQFFYSPSSTTFTLNVLPMQITTASLANAAVGSPYSATLSELGGHSPVSWSIASGSLPSGLSLNASTGAISGTPTTAQTATFTVKATDHVGTLTATKAFKLTVSPAVQPEVWVTNGGNSEVNAFSLNPADQGSPLTTISGSGAGLAGTAGVAVDTTGTVYVGNTQGGTVTEYGLGHYGSPSKTITGAGVAYPAALTLDSSGRLYVANQTNNEISVFAAGASGAAAPYATIQGQNTNLSSPDGLAVDSSGNLWVANASTNSVTEYQAGAITAGNDDPSPLHTITAGIDGPSALAISGNELLVADRYHNQVTGYSLSSPGIAVQTITSSALNFPNGIDVDASGNIYVSNQFGNSVTVFAPNAAAGATPTSTIGANLSSPGQLAVVPPLNIRTTHLPHAVRGRHYRAQLIAALGTEPYHWRIVRGHLPAGLRLDAATGLISGRPRGFGTYRFVVRVTDSTHPRMSANQELFITVRATGLGDHRGHRGRLRHRRAPAATSRSRGKPGRSDAGRAG